MYCIEITMQILLVCTNVLTCKNLCEWEWEWHSREWDHESIPVQNSILITTTTTMLWQQQCWWYWRWRLKFGECSVSLLGTTVVHPMCQEFWDRAKYTRVTWNDSCEHLWARKATQQHANGSSHKNTCHTVWLSV